LQNLGLTVPQTATQQASNRSNATATFGDDRALTNRVLRTWRVTYQETARAETVVPERLLKIREPREFMQLLEEKSL